MSRNRSVTFAIIFLVLLPSTIAFGQKKKFNPGDPAKWKADIQSFEEKDKELPPAKEGIVFVGSSTIRLWNTNKWFPEDSVINRGFGGSQTSDTLHYFDRIVSKHEPRLIVIYAGTNDIKDGESPQQVFEDYRRLMIKIMERLPKSEVVCISIKPTIARWKLWPKMNQANEMIKGLCSIHSKWYFEDVTQLFLGDDGTPRADYLSKDKLHLNEAGYEVLTARIAKHINRVHGGIQIYAPASFQVNERPDWFVRVRTSNESADVEFKIGDGAWSPMKFDSGTNFKLWRAQMPSGLAPGHHRVDVRWRDGEDQFRHGKMTFSVIN